MHAAVWSQPGRRAKLSTAHCTPAAPNGPSGRALLATSVFLALAGGFLAALGLTGCFVRGPRKLHLGWGIPAGVIVLLAGVAGTRTATGRCRTFFYIALTVVACCGALAMITLGALTLRAEGSALISVLAAAETALGSLATCLCVLGVTFAVVGSGFPAPRNQSRNVVPQSP